MKTVSSVIKKIMREEPYYGLFACGLNKEFSNHIDTAGVCLDGINYKLLVNKDFWEKLSPEFRYGVIKHELLHLVFYHVIDQADWSALCPDHNMLNIAMDMEVQSHIDEKYRYTECAAEKLFKEYPNVPRKMGTKFYIKFVQQIMKSDPNESINGGNSAGIGQAIIRGNAKNRDHNNWGNLTEGLKDLAKNQIDYQQKETAKQTLKSQGLVPGELKELLETLLNPRPPVFNWKSYFRRLLGVAFDIYQKKTRRKESERFEDAFGLKRKKKHKLLVAIDTSGSVSQEELSDFFTEIRHIWKAGADVHILECDAKITNEYDYTGKTPDSISGRGGTSFTPCVEYYNKHRKEYTTMVYFTDGYGDQGQCKPLNKMLWVITSQGNQEAQFPGVKICIPKKDK